ncbi:hypothetical protein [Microbacterium sp. 1.5R]|uniref:hypothetical protein n=1 Tax=Microbacterium sp. 1.5R TaxID=1916917 RepID=UPI0011A85F1B|nr:hypothetical protein [Microbacterium sp. 1.5R]
MSDPSNTQGTPGSDEEADTASGGAPDDSGDKRYTGETDGPDDSDDSDDVRETLDDQTTDDEGKPLENPSGG